MVPPPPGLFPFSLHDALPISIRCDGEEFHLGGNRDRRGNRLFRRDVEHRQLDVATKRSEEHTSELQSPVQLVCRLLLEKKKITDNTAEPGTLANQEASSEIMR